MAAAFVEVTRAGKTKEIWFWGNASVLVTESAVNVSGALQIPDADAVGVGTVVGDPGAPVVAGARGNNGAAAPDPHPAPRIATTTNADPHAGTRARPTITLLRIVVMGWTDPPRGGFPAAAIPPRHLVRDSASSVFDLPPVTPGRDAGTVENQLQLPLVGDTTGRPVRPAPDSDWRIDETTRRAGRRGLAAARAALARSAALGDTRADAA